MLKKICSVLTGVAMMFQITSMSGISEEISMEDIQIEESNLDVLDSSEYLAGDVNCDGNFSVIDVVALQKWLLGKGNLDCWQNADLTQDGIINIFDLCFMKRKLIDEFAKKKYPVDNPIVIDEFTPCTVTMNDVFEDWVVLVTIKHQYSIPERIWSIADFENVENIKTVLQYKNNSPYRQVVEIYLQETSKENVIKMINDIEALHLVEVKEVQTFTFFSGLPEED